MRPLLVGECNPYDPEGKHPGLALFPYPKRAAGARLCQIMGLDRYEYGRRYDKVNLVYGKWSMKKARDRAQELQKERRLFVLLGAKVCDAFGVPFEPFTIQVKTTSAAVAILLKVPHQEWTFVVLPHPSGRNRLWNDPLAVDKARKVLKEAGVL